jgi:hypothetical protein
MAGGTPANPATLAGPEELQRRFFELSGGDRRHVVTSAERDESRGWDGFHQSLCVDRDVVALTDDD